MTFYKVFAIGLAILAMSGAGCENKNNPIIPPTPIVRQIAFVSQDGIYIIKDDATELKKLADGKEISLSPDGKNIIFTTIAGNNLEIFVMAVDGSAQRNLTQTPVSDSEGQWSPDGSMIAYQSGPHSSADHLWVINADGSGKRQITADTTAFNHSPCWSPDGSRITFEWSHKDTQGNYDGYGEIHLINIDGAGEINLVSNAVEPEWCPDGSMLAFRRQDFNFVINSDGSGLRSILPNEPNIYLGDVTWSPDGRQITFVQYTEQTGNIYVINKDGSGKTKLTQFTNGGVDAITWCNDGKRIAFSHEGALYIIKPDGSDLRKITEDLGVREVRWVPEKK